MATSAETWTVPNIMLGLSVAAIGFEVWYFRRKSHESKAKDQWREHPDPAAVEAQRQLFADGEFRRKVLSWSPMDLRTDRGDLECGHYTTHYTPSKDDRPTETDCWRCAADYLEKARTTFQGNRH